MVGAIPVLVTGGQGGGVALWDLERHRRLMGITLDSAVERLAIVTVEPQLFVTTADKQVHEFDIVLAPEYLDLTSSVGNG
jgi:hypothetical protein